MLGTRGWRARARANSARSNLTWERRLRNAIKGKTNCEPNLDRADRPQTGLTPAIYRCRLTSLSRLPPGWCKHLEADRVTTAEALNLFSLPVRGLKVWAQPIAFNTVPPAEFIVSSYGRSSKKPLGSGFDHKGVAPQIVADINRNLSHDNRDEQVVSKDILMLLVVGVAHVRLQK
jgi:hypothetical protein